MRVNGNYFERFLFSAFPFILLGGLIFYSFKRPDIVIVFISMLIISAIIFLIDKLPLWKTRLLNFTIVDNKLFVNDREIDVTEINIIRPYKTSPPQSLLVFEVHFQDNSQLDFMDRPKTIFYKSKNKLRSKSLDILFNKFPFLKTKLREQHY